MIREYHLGIRINDSLKEDLQKLADKDNRSLADYARLVLVAHVKSKKEEES
jgi:predicted transcriptional regulator